MSYQNVRHNSQANPQNELLVDNKRMKQVIDQLNEDLLHQQQHSTMKDQLITQLQQQIVQIQQQMQIIKSTNQRPDPSIQNQLNDLKLDKETLLEQLRRKQQELDELKHNMGKQYNDNNQSLTNRMMLLQKEHERVLQMNDQQTNQINYMSQKLEQTNQTQNKLNNLGQEHINDLQSRDRDISYLKQQLDEHNKLKSELEHFKSLCMRMEKEVEELRRQHQRDLGLIQNKYHTDTENLKGQHQQFVNDQKLDNQKRLGDTKLQMDYNLNDLGRNKDQNIKQLQDVIRQMQEDQQNKQNNMTIHIQQDRDALTRQIQTLIDQNQGFKNKFSVLENQYGNHKNQLEINHKMHNDGLMQEIDKYKYDHQNHNQQIQEMQKKLYDHNEMKNYSENAQNENQALKYQIDEMTRYLNQLKMQLKDAAEQNQYLLNQADLLLQKGNDTQQQQNELGQQLMEIRSLENKCRELTIQLANVPALEAKLRSLKNHEDETIKQRDQIYQLQEAYNALQVTFRSMSRQAEQTEIWKDKYNDLLQELDRMRQIQQNLIAENDYLKSQLNLMTNQNQQNQNIESDKWINRNLLLQDQITKLQYQLDNNTSNQDNQVQQMQNEINYLKNQLDKSKRDYMSQVNIVEESNNQRKQISVFQLQLEEANNDVRRIQNINNDLQVKITTTERQRNDDTNQRNELDHYKNRMGQLLGDLNQSNSQLTNIKNLYSNLQSQKQNNPDQTGRIDQLMIQIRNLEKALQDSEGKRNILQNELRPVEQLKRDNENYRNELERVKQRLVDVEPQLQYLLDVEQDHQKALGRFERVNVQSSKY